VSEFIVERIGELVTLAPLAKANRFSSIIEKDIERIKDAWLVVKDGKIFDYGSGPKPEVYARLPAVDAIGGLVLPGFVDSHTHPIFAGSRVNEFVMRLNGETYQQIAAQGGGIQSTVQATRNTADVQMLLKLEERLHSFLFHGVTSVEMKSGYGLSVDHEIRLLRLLQQAKHMTKQKLYVTCLALHAVPREYNSAKEYAIDCATQLLDIVAQEKLADAVDAFIENGYFSVDDCREYLEKAKSLKFDIRLHADEFSHSDAGEAAVEFEARSADHLQYTSQKAIAGMAKRGIVATLLPGTSLYTGIPYTDARPFTEGGCPVAVATDFNPGSCYIDNISLVASLAAVHCKLTLPQAIAAVTLVPAYSLGFHHSKGALAKGYDADFTIFHHHSLDEWIADFGKTLPDKVFIQGADAFSHLN